MMRPLSDVCSELAGASDHGGPRRCLYVAKGPSAVHALDFLGWGDIATVNAAGLLFPRIDWSFWCDVPPGSEIAGFRDRCRAFVVPNQLHTGTFDFLRLTHGRRATEDVPDFPRDRTVVYPYDFIKDDRRSILRNLRHGRVPMCMTAPAGLFILARHLCYREIWCFGHDGGMGYATGIPLQRSELYNYDKFRRAMETVADWLRTELDTTIHFWPERPARTE